MLAHQNPAKKKRPMDSNMLLKLGFCEWKPFGKATIGKTPESKGVYAFRSSKPLDIRTGSSDITYVGRAMSDKKGAYHNIKHSLNEYLHPGHDNPTKKRVGEKALAEEWQVSWMLTDSPAQVECHLLRQFYHDHGQLPPQNRRWPEGCMPEQ